MFILGKKLHIASLKVKPWLIFLYKSCALSKYPHLQSLNVTNCLLTWHLFCILPKCSSRREDCKCVFLTLIAKIASVYRALFIFDTISSPCVQ